MSLKSTYNKGSGTPGAGAELTIQDTLSGTGVVKQIWLLFDNDGQALNDVDELRFYIDGEATASIKVLMPELFDNSKGLLATAAAFETPVKKCRVINIAAGDTDIFWIPNVAFSTSIKVTFYRGAGVANMDVYFWILTAST